MSVKDLEIDMMESWWFKNKVRDDRDYAEALYSALCNIQWYPLDSKNIDEDIWTCSWRYAGEIVGRMRQPQEDYICFYCGGGEGSVREDIEEDLRDLGWKWRQWPES